MCSLVGIHSDKLQPAHFEEPSFFAQSLFFGMKRERLQVMGALFLWSYLFRSVLDNLIQFGIEVSKPEQPCLTSTATSLEYLVRLICILDWSNAAMKNLRRLTWASRKMCLISIL